MSDLIQHAIVTMIALGCAGLTAARVFGGFRRGAEPSRGCTGCPSAKHGSCGPQVLADPNSPRPVTLYKRSG